MVTTNGNATAAISSRLFSSCHFCQLGASAARMVALPAEVVLFEVQAEPARPEVAEARHGAAVIRAVAEAVRARLVEPEAPGAEPLEARPADWAAAACAVVPAELALEHSAEPAESGAAEPPEARTDE